MATRGHLGGLAGATPQALRVLDAAGCDVVLVETVGVGQSEVEVAALADTTVVLLAPGMGDGIQAAKAGILEVGDVYVVNKADRDGADPGGARAAAHGRARRARRVAGAGRCGRVASRGEGVDELVAALDAHRRWSDGSGERERRRVARAEAEIEAIAVARLRARIRDVHGGAGLLRPGQTGGGGRAGPLRRGRRAATRPGRTRVEIRRRPGIVGGAD